MGVRLTDAERAALDRAAADNGLGASPFARMVLLNYLREKGYIQ